VEIRPCAGNLERELAFDLRRSVLCGELHLDREAAKDELDETAVLALAWLGDTPIGTGRLLKRGEFWVLEHLCVLPLQRRQGRGRKLLEHLAAQAPAGAGLAAVSPVGAAPFFQHCGFTQVSVQGDVVLLKR
jgi:GNAT superfamily N-acetyltransferase